VLFALDLARAEIRRTGVAVIVEGYFDAIMAHQAGFTNVVAALGTSLSEAQLRQLHSGLQRLVLALDADPAGMHAVLRGLASAREAFAETSLELGPRGLIRLSGQLGVDLRVLTLPEGMDPDELIRRDPQAWARAVETARPVIAFLLDYLAARFPWRIPKGRRPSSARWCPSWPPSPIRWSGTFTSSRPPAWPGSTSGCCWNR
jgi:DNA primase